MIAGHHRHPPTHDRQPAARRQALAAGASLLLLAVTARAKAETAWPTRPLRIVVGYPAGGLVDALARAYGEALAARLSQPVVIDNKPGAAGMLAGGEVARSSDGHTLWFTLSGTVNQNRVLYRKLPYDAERDFVPVAGFDPGPSVVAVPAASPLRRVQDLVELAQRQVVSFGNYAQGSHPHMLAQQLASRHGLKVEQVPYKGEAPMWMDVASGQLTLGMGSPLGLAPHLQTGRARAIAVTTRRRSPALPEVPTFEEQGLAAPVFVMQGWIGLLAPARTPAATVQRLSELVLEAAATPRVRQLHRNFGLAELPWGHAEFQRIDRESRPAWIELARELNLTLD